MAYNARPRVPLGIRLEGFQTQPRQTRYAFGAPVCRVESTSELRYNKVLKVEVLIIFLYNTRTIMNELINQELTCPPVKSLETSPESITSDCGSSACQLSELRMPCLARMGPTAVFSAVPKSAARCTCSHSTPCRRLHFCEKITKLSKNASRSDRPSAKRT